MRCHLPSLTLRYKAYFVVFFVLFQVTVIPFDEALADFNFGAAGFNLTALIPFLTNELRTFLLFLV